jgi:predicted transcriptional regulator
MPVSVDVLFTNVHGTLQTSVLQTVTLNTQYSPHYDNKLAKIDLVYDLVNNTGIIPPNSTSAGHLSGSHYWNGVRVEEGRASFTVKIIPLSSQHANHRFRFKITIEDETFFSTSFRTVSKLIRKKKKHQNDTNQITKKQKNCMQTCEDDELELEMALTDIFVSNSVDDDKWSMICNSWHKLKELQSQQLQVQLKMKELQSEQFQLQSQVAAQCCEIGMQMSKITSNIADV